VNQDIPKGQKTHVKKRKKKEVENLIIKVMLMKINTNLTSRLGRVYCIDKHCVYQGSGDHPDSGYMFWGF
jgi:hypothetical protein